MTDRPHPDLDAPLSEAEAAEARQIRLCGVWYRAGGCLLPKKHDGPHLNAAQAEKDRLVAEVRRLRAALASIERKLDVARLGLDRDGPQHARITEAREIARAALAGGTGTSDAWCPHGHVGCCGHHDLEDMPIHKGGDCR